MASLSTASPFTEAYLRRILRFALVGIVTFGINFASFAFLFDLLHADYRVAVTLSFAATVSCHFFLNKIFTFEAGAKKVRDSAPPYALLVGVNYLITLFVFWLTVEVAGASPYAAVFLATAGTAMSSFLSMQYCIFRVAPAA